MVNQSPHVFQDVTNHLLDYQMRVDKLSDRSTDIYPIYLRRDLEDYGVKARSLVDYQHNEVRTYLFRF